MSHPHFTNPTSSRCVLYARLAGVFAMVAGLLVLLGWLLDVAILKTVLPGAASMKPNTAICVVLAGLALTIFSLPSEERGPGKTARRLASLSSLLLGLIAAVTILEYALNLDLHVDNLVLFHQPAPAEAARMAEATAVGFGLLSLALLLLDTRRRALHWLQNSAALAGATLGLIAFLGYLYGVKALYNFYFYSSMALHTSVLLFGLSLGVLLVRPERGVVSALTSNYSGGVMARRILPVAFLLPLLMGWLRLKGEQAGFYESAFGLAMFVAGNVLTFTVLVLLTAAAVNRADQERGNANELLRRSEERSRLLIDGVTDYAIFMLDPSGHVVTWNQGAQRCKGYRADEIIGKSFSCFYPPGDREAGKPEAELRQALAAGVCRDENWRVRKDGSKFWANVTLSAIRNDDGQLLGFAKVTRDLTERRAAEQAMRESEQRFRLMANSAPVMLWVSGTDKLCTFFNKTWLDFTGRTMEQELGNGWAEGVHPDDHARCWQIYSDAFEARKQFTMDYRLRRRDGEYRWISDDGVPRFDAAGTFVGYIGSCVDITERKRAGEERLRLLNVLEASLNEIYIFDASSLRFEYVNRGAQRNLGYSLAELRQLTPIELKPEHTESSFRKTIEPLLSGAQEKLVFHTIHRRKNGSDYPVEVHLQLVEQSERRVFLAVILDISDRRQAERAIRENQQRLAGLVDSAMDGIITIDSEQRIVLFNPAAEMMFGLSAAEVLGGSLEQLLPQASRAEHASHIRKFGATGVSSRRMGALGSISGRRADGSEFPMEASISQVPVEGKTFYTVILRDITERDRAEKALQEANESLERKVRERTAQLAAAKERAEFADSNKTAFLASMSHEIRTPLNAVVGFTGMLLMKLPGPLNEAQEVQLRTVQSSAQHLLSLINDLLDLAKVEAGRLVINKQKVVCQGVIDEVAASLRPLAETKGLALRTAAPAQECFVETDRRILSQILINLANNAIKFTDQGEVEIALTSQGQDAASFACFEVTDTGVGIRPEDQEKLFHAFEQLGSNGHQFEGSGLGLHLSQKLAAELQGRIEVESQVGAGSRFRLLLPQQF
jgi:protein-histidine pros-kinase